MNWKANSLSKAIVASLCLAVNCFAAPVRSVQAGQNPSIDFNAALDGSLANLPAMSIISQGLLRELERSNEVEVSGEAGSAQDSWVRSTNRTGKENGQAFASLIGGMLIPEFFKIKADGPVAGKCRGIIDSAVSMSGAVVTQEVA